MNDSPEPFPDPTDEAMLDELLARLGRLEPSLETRLHNRLVVADELKRVQLASRNRRLPWWRRSLSIPVPLAAAALVLLITLAALASFRAPPTDSHGPLAAPPQPAPAGELAARAAAPRPEQDLGMENYIYGVGWLKSELTYRSQE